METTVRFTIVAEYASVDEVALFHIRLEYLPTLYCQAGLGKGHYAGFNLKRCEACQRNLVTITAALCTAYLKSLAAGLGVEGQGDSFALLDKVVSVPLGSYKDECHRLVPQPSETASGGGHRIERFAGSGSDEHPLTADEVELVFCAKDAEVCFFHRTGYCFGMSIV